MIKEEKACYRLQKEPLWACLRHCELTESDNWWFLPDIQRSFVWSARSTIKLLDSLLRGWPFGVLTVQQAMANECAIVVPFRHFLKETGSVNEGSSTFGYSVPFEHDVDIALNHFSLVLDGQQRLQSLLFAFADENTGYVQNEKEWMLDLWGWCLRKVRNQDFKKCPLAGVYIDLKALVGAFAFAGRFEDIRYADKKVICYGISQQDFTSSYYERDKDRPFPVRKKDAYCLKLSKLWRFLREVSEGKDCFPSSDKVVALLRQKASQPGWDLNDIFIEEHGGEIAEFARYLFERVYTLEVGRVELHRPEGVQDGAFQRDVVEIFTRLNHEGKTLTLPEITGAWIKNYWNYQKTPQGAVVSIENLKGECSQKGLESFGFMRYASALWAVSDYQCEKRKVVQNKDLSDPVLLKSLAEWLSNHWQEISKATLQTLEMFSGKRWIFQIMGGLDFPLAVLVALRMRFNQASQQMNEHDKAHYLHAFLGPIKEKALRFLACSSWSGYWTIDTIGQWGRKCQSECNGNDEMLMTAFQSLLDEKLVPRALNAFNATHVSNRGQVRAYYPYLAIWHRLNKKRLMAWESNLASDDLHVDHCVSFARWLEIRGEKMDSITLEQDNDYNMLINSLGNCMLLNGSTNIGRGKRSFRDFFGWLWPEQENTENVEARQALGMTEAMANPLPNNVDCIMEDIQRRDKDMRKEIQKFILGELTVQA